MIARGGMIRALLLAAGLSFAAGCGDDGAQRPKDGSTTVDTGGKDGGPPPGKTLTFITEDLDGKNAGKHAVAASNGSTVGVAYFRTVAFPPGVTVTCQPTFPGAQPTAKNRPAQDLYYIEYDGSSWGTPVKVDQTVGPSFGLSISMDKAGKRYVGYLGGKAMAELSLVECSSSNATIASSSNGTAWTSAAVDTAGGTGDTVGHWMSLSLDSTGKVHASHRDVHFGYYEQDGNTKASLRYDSTKVSDDNGSGVYSSLVFDAKDNPVIAHYNGTKMGAEGGLQLAHKLSGKWESTQVAGAKVGERIGLVHHNGTFGMVYYSAGDSDLRYIQTSDPKTWGNAEKVDNSLTHHGQFPSLAYDSKGNPAVTYYRCSDYGASKCDAQKDGLMLAYRFNGAWKNYEIDKGDTQFCGDYTALAFNSSDQPIVAYRCVTFDNLSKEWVDTLKAAKGVWK